MMRIMAAVEMHSILRALFAALLCLAQATVRAELRVPAHTAYLEPDSGGARVSSKSGVIGWKNPEQTVLWFGELKSPGTIEVSLELRLPDQQTSKLRLTVAGQSREAEAPGASWVCAP